MRRRRFKITGNTISEIPGPGYHMTDTQIAKGDQIFGTNYIRCQEGCLQKVVEVNDFSNRICTESVGNNMLQIFWSEYGFINGWCRLRAVIGGINIPLPFI